MKKRTRIFAALLSGILLLAGCAGSSEDLDTTTVPSTAAQEELPIGWEPLSDTLGSRNRRNRLKCWAIGI